MTMRVVNFNEFIEQNKEAISEQLKEVVQPTFIGLDNPEQYAPEIGKMVKLKRPPFERQARLIAAAHQHLRKNPYIILSAEMGTGKTQMGITLHHLGNYRVTGVMCPSHLVAKWAEEFEKVLGKGKHARARYKIVIVSKWTDLKDHVDVGLEKGVQYIFIFSKETAKLGYPKVPVYKEKTIFVQKERRNDDDIPVIVTEKAYTANCTRCGTQLLEDEVSQKVFLEMAKIPYKCPACKEVLRQPKSVVAGAEKAKGVNRRLSIADYVQRQLPAGFFDLLIVDELHELKGGDTGQGNAFGTISAKAKKVIGLTGTLLNGYASSLFYILYRLDPKMMKEELGLEYNDVQKFIDLYGAVEEKYDAKEVDSEGVVTRKGRKLNVREIPRISPHLLTRLLPKSIFLRLDEMNVELPAYEEIVERITPDEEYIHEYNRYLQKLASEIRAGDKSLLGSLAADSQSILDLPFMPKSAGKISYDPPVTREQLPLTAKEKKLVDRVRAELDEGRKCLVYITYSKLGTTEEVVKVLTDALPGKKVLALPDNVEPKRRQKWIENNPCDVLITNPEKVKTGLDLLEYPTIIFYQTTYNVFTLKQASRRSWRIGQKHDVKVYFFVYEDTPQAIALSLISKKLATANSLEGRLGDDDLAAEADEGDNIAVALAKSIIGEKKETDIETSKIVYGKRESDPFEKYYLDILNRIKESDSAIDEIVQEKIDEARFEEALESKTEVSETKVEEPVDIAPEDEDEVEKITVYKVIRQGKKSREIAVEITKNDIHDMIAESKKDEGVVCLQPSLF